MTVIAHSADTRRKKYQQLSVTPLKIYIYRNNSPISGTLRKKKVHFGEVKQTVETSVAPSPKSPTPRSSGLVWVSADRR